MTQARVGREQAPPAVGASPQRRPRTADTFAAREFPGAAEAAAGENTSASEPTVTRPALTALSSRSALSFGTSRVPGAEQGSAGDTEAASVLNDTGKDELKHAKAFAGELSSLGKQCPTLS
ncbi:hypothetical protein ACQPZZ_04440 [Microbispora sp. CA-135349]|uniref:hypothetical protein n=1 Tax=Microbispora sp. CA-135349 TaxID=3239953 RepID=UPI003D8EB71F